MKNMGMVTKVAEIFFFISQTPMVSKARAAKSWLADPKMGHSLENSPDANKSTDRMTTIVVERYLFFAIT